MVFRVVKKGQFPMVISMVKRLSSWRLLGCLKGAVLDGY